MFIIALVIWLYYLKSAPRLLIASPFSPLGLTEDYHSWYYFSTDRSGDKSRQRTQESQRKRTTLVFLFLSFSLFSSSPAVPDSPLVEIYRSLSLIGASSIWILLHITIALCSTPSSLFWVWFNSRPIFWYVPFIKEFH